MVAIISGKNTRNTAVKQFEKNKNSTTDCFLASEYIEFYINIKFEGFEFCIKWDQIAFMSNGFDILTLAEKVYDTALNWGD